MLTEDKHMGAQVIPGLVLPYVIPNTVRLDNWQIVFEIAPKIYY